MSHGAPLPPVRRRALLGACRRASSLAKSALLSPMLFTAQLATRIGRSPGMACNDMALHARAAAAGRTQWIYQRPPSRSRLTACAARAAGIGRQLQGAAHFHLQGPTGNMPKAASRRTSSRSRSRSRSLPQQTPMYSSQLILIATLQLSAS